MRNVSQSTVRRLSVYVRVLEDLERRGGETVSSRGLADRAGTTSAQVRKDLSYFGSFGKRGLGYSVPELLKSLRAILGLDRAWGVAVVGAGRIGQALARYPDFANKGFDVRAVFDNDPQKIGQRWDDLEVLDVGDLPQVFRERQIEIVILATGAESAQSVANQVVACGVRAILNFAPVKLQVPAGVGLNNVNMVPELESLSFGLTNPQATARGVSGASQEPS